MGRFLSSLVPPLKESGDTLPAALRAAVPGPTGRTAQRSAFPGLHPVRPRSDTRFAALGAAVPV